MGQLATADAAQEVALRCGLDALGDDGQIETFGHTDHGADQGDILLIGRQVGDEGAVELDLADRQPLDVAQA